MKPPCAIVPLVWQYSRRTVNAALSTLRSGSHPVTWKLPIDSLSALPERMRSSRSSFMEGARCRLGLALDRAFQVGACGFLEARTHRRREIERIAREKPGEDFASLRLENLRGH